MSKRSPQNPVKSAALNPNFSKVIDKGLRILSLFNPDRPSLSLKEITQETGINKTSTFRFVDTLIILGYLRKDAQTKMIKLGPKALAMSYNIIRSFDLLQIVKPYIDRAFETYKISIDSGFIEGDSILMLYVREASDTLFVRPSVVENAAHCCAIGKAILANLPEDRMKSIVQNLRLSKRTPNSLTDQKALVADLIKTKERGYSINNEEYLIGLLSIGAPLMNPETKIAVGAVAFNISPTQMDMQTFEKKYSSLIIELAKNISEMIPGW